MNMRKGIVGIGILLFLVSIFLVNWHPDRTNFVPLFIAYTVAFLSYLLLIREQRLFTFKQVVGIAFLAQLLMLFSEPHLSIDYYRFIWDGEITWLGYNPFDFTPQALYEAGSIEGNAYMQEVYEGIGPMSQAHYSCYPPVNQAYFLFATAFTDSLFVNTLLLKLAIIATQVVGAYYLFKILQLLRINVSRMWMLYLNPLWIVECTGNVHFEGVMLSLLFIALYYILQKRIPIGSILFAIAVQIKLIPLMLLPFFYRFLGLWKALLLYMLTGVIVVALALLQIDQENMYFFADSLRLYFEVFEFNSFVLHYYVQYGIAETGWNLTKTYGPQLSRIAIGLIMTLALYGQIDDWKKLFKRMTLAFFCYLLLSSTLHPWYVLPMLTLTLFTNYSFPLVWSFLIFFSYVFYQYEGRSELIRWVIDTEYVVLLCWFAYELFSGKSPLKFLRVSTYEE